MIIEWNKKELSMLSNMDIPFDFSIELSSEQLEELYDIVPDYMLEHTDTNDVNPCSDFNICEDIITKFANAMKIKGLFD